VSGVPVAATAPRQTRSTRKSRHRPEVTSTNSKSTSRRGSMPRSLPGSPASAINDQLVRTSRPYSQCLVSRYRMFGLLSVLRHLSRNSLDILRLIKDF